MVLLLDEFLAKSSEVWTDKASTIVCELSLTPNGKLTNIMQIISTHKDHSFMNLWFQVQ